MGIFVYGVLEERRFGVAKKVISSFGGGFELAEVGRSRSVMPQLLQGLSRVGSCGGGAFML